MSGANCKWPSCRGTVEDGFCDTCGRPPLGAATAPSSSSRRRRSPAAPRPMPGPARPSPVGVSTGGGTMASSRQTVASMATGNRSDAVAARGAAPTGAPAAVQARAPAPAEPRPAPPAPGFTVIEDNSASGFSEPGTINVTNRLRRKARQQPMIGTTGYAARTAQKSSSTRRPRASTASQSSSAASSGSAGSGSGSSRGRSRSSSGSRGRGRALGGGLVNMPVMPFLDPLQMVITDMRIHEKKCNARPARTRSIRTSASARIAARSIISSRR